MKVKATQSHPTLCYPEVLQARILEWEAIPFSRGSSQLRAEPRSPIFQEDSLSSETPGKPNVKRATEATDDEEGTYLSIPESNVLTHLS